MAVLLSFLASASYFTSWQKYNDDFPGTTLNTTFWKEDYNNCCFGGACNGDYGIKVDGIASIVARTSSGAGVAEGRWTTMRSVQNFKDGKSYNITFTLLPSVGNYNDLESGIKLAIVNDTSANYFTFTGNCVGLSIGDLGNILTFNASRVKNNYNLVINKDTKNFSLYNETGIVTSEIIERPAWYLLFASYVRSTNQNYNNTFIVYNFTVKSMLSVDINLISPANKTDSGDYNPSFYANFTMSDALYNISNVTLFIWNASNSALVNSTFFNMGNNQSFSTVNISVKLHYGLYNWNYKAVGTDGASFDTSWGNKGNFTYNLTDKTDPSLAILSPGSTISSNEFVVKINTSDWGGLDSCYFNITRGASVEVGTTRISNCSDLNTSVSGEASYVLHVFVNDTSANFNYTAFYFTYSTSSPPSGGGGGGSASFIDKLTPVRGNICNSTEKPLSDSWKEFKKDMTWDNFKILWFSYWDYSRCKSAGSIIPLD